MSEIEAVAYQESVLQAHVETLTSIAQNGLRAGTRDRELTSAAFHNVPLIVLQYHQKFLEEKFPGVEILPVPLSKQHVEFWGGEAEMIAPNYADTLLTILSRPDQPAMWGHIVRLPANAEDLPKP